VGGAANRERAGAGTASPLYRQASRIRQDRIGQEIGALRSGVTCPDQRNSGRCSFDAALRYAGLQRLSPLKDVA
jgi:hypothetical protein